MIFLISMPGCNDVEIVRMTDCAERKVTDLRRQLGGSSGDNLLLRTAKVCRPATDHPSRLPHYLLIDNCLVI
jgi:hypothetical protein